MNADTGRLVLPWACCLHCGCSEHERIGHDDTCRHGCNDDQPEHAASPCPIRGPHECNRTDHSDGGAI